MDREHVQDVEQQRPGRAPAGERAPSLRGPEAALLGLQGLAGNAAVSRLVAARAEEDELPEGPDWAAPIEPEADERAEAVDAEADERAETAVQRHADEETVDWRAEPAAPAPRSILAPPEPVQRQGAGAAAGGAAAPAAPAAPTTFPAYKNIRYNGTVLAEAWNAWKQTLNAATKTSRREQGFWIQWDATTVANATGTYRATGHVTGASVGPAAGATINLGAKPADTPPWYTVGSFHTHTPTRYRKVGRVVGPSGADNTADTTDNVAGVVYDYSPVKGGAIPAGHPIWSPSTISHSGPDRRT